MNRNVLLMLIIVVAVVAVVLVGVILLRAKQPSPETVPLPAPDLTPPSEEEILPEEETLPETTAPEEETPEVRTVTVSATEFSFSPSEIKASAGETLEIVLTNDGTVGHNFAIPELGVSTPVIEPGQQTSLTVTLPDRSITFESECTVPGHKERGMVGRIVVQ